VKRRTITTRRGIALEVMEAGEGTPLLYLHGVTGLLDHEPLIEALAGRYRVHAPIWPGYGPEAEDSGEIELEDMLDFALHGWDIAEALGLEHPHLLGHCMGGMIAAEMACLAPQRIDKLVLVAALGLWLDAHPIPDLFATSPFKIAETLFHDAQAGEALLGGGADFSQDGALTDFMVGNARRLGMAGKILFPIPNRRVDRRLYRVGGDALVLWGRRDQWLVPAYAERWQALLPAAQLAWIDDAAHMLPYEAPAEAAEAITKFLA